MRAPLLVVVAALLIGTPAFGAPVDIVIVIDNSGSMRDNDPLRLAHTAVQRLVESSAPDTRIGLVTFDAGVRLDLPLTPVPQLSGAALDAALAALDYRGQRTDIPGAIERALYHFQEAGRADAASVVLLLTDGIVDTGDAARDRDRERWMLDELAADAHARGIRIFGIAFSDGADFRLIQALAHATGAEYRRVLAPEGLPAAFAAMLAAITVAPVETPAEAPLDSPEPAPQVAAQDPPQPTPEAERSTWPWWMAALVVLAAGVAWFRRGRRPAASKGGYPPGAVLVDAGQVSGRPRIGLNGPISVIGRVPAPDPMRVTSVVLDRQTISRKHATIEWSGGEYWLEDHNSANGSFVDDTQVTGRVVLHDGARLRFDEFEFEFRLVPEDRTQVRGDEQSSDETLVRATTVFPVHATDD